MDNIAFSLGTAFHSRFGNSLGLGDLVSLILSNAIIMAGLIFFILFIYFGFTLIVSSGGENSDALVKLRNHATSAAIGFVVVFCSYWIIRIIETLTGVDILKSTL